MLRIAKIQHFWKLETVSFCVMRCFVCLTFAASKGVWFAVASPDSDLRRWNRRHPKLLKPKLLKSWDQADCCWNCGNNFRFCRAPTWVRWILISGFLWVSPISTVRKWEACSSCGHTTSSARGHWCGTSTGSTGTFSGIQGCGSETWWGANWGKRGGQKKTDTYDIIVVLC